MYLAAHRDSPGLPKHDVTLPAQAKAADLAERLGVYVRTLHSYYGTLDVLSIHIYADLGSYGGISLVLDYKLLSLDFPAKEGLLSTWAPAWLGSLILIILLHTAENLKSYRI